MKVLKFSADWCNPCQTLAKTLESMDLNVEIESVDIDAEPSRVAKFGIRGVPTMVLVDDNGKELSRSVGVMSSKEILEWLN
jgi:thioredoxin 1